MLILQNMLFLLTCIFNCMECYQVTFRLNFCDMFPQETSPISLPFISYARVILYCAGEYCYWGRGEKYRGVVGVAESGRKCMVWSEQFQVPISDHRELLGGHNFCRNPGGTRSQPWCYTHAGADSPIREEFCNLHKCGKLRNKYWLSVIKGKGQDPIYSFYPTKK